MERLLTLLAVAASCASATTYYISPSGSDFNDGLDRGRPFKTFTSAALVAEEMALRARGMRLNVITPDAGSAEAIGPNLMNQHRVEHVLDAGFRQGLAV